MPKTRSTNNKSTKKTSKADSSSLLMCTPEECTNDQDNDFLKCDKCARKVHYRCTRLPAYQIQLFISSTTKQYQFQCEKCVTVEQKLLELVPNRERSHPSLKTEREMESLRRDIKGCENVIKQKVEKENELKKIITNKDADLADIKNKMQNNPGYHTLEYIEDKFEKKLESFREHMTKAIKEEWTIVAKSYADTAKSNAQIDPAVVQTPECLKKVIKNAREEELAEENERKRRSKNLVLHGVNENEKDVRSWAVDLVKDLHVSVNIKKVSRIGIEREEKKRPILFEFESEDDKDKLFSNLGALKDIEKYKNLSIMEDLTTDQRRAIKELSEEAKKKNSDNESEQHVWRVRGSSKNGFFIKKIKKRRLANQQ